MEHTPLPFGWQAIYDDAHQRHYYYNTRTGESIWEVPTEPAFPEPSPPPPPPPPPPADHGASPNAPAPDLDGSLAATESMLNSMKDTQGSSSSGKFDSQRPGYANDDSEDEEEEPYVFEDPADTGYDSDGNPINYDNMEVNYGDVYGGDDDDGWIAAVNPTVKPPKEMGTNPLANMKPRVMVPPPPGSAAGQPASNAAASATAAAAAAAQRGRSAGAAAPDRPKLQYKNAMPPVPPRFPNVMVAYERGTNHEHIQCVITRDRSGITAKMYPTYELRLEALDTPLLLAKKMNMNRTSNYHLFDLTRGTNMGMNLFSKNSGNFIGKLRARDLQRTEYVLLNAASTEREEVAAIVFDRMDVMTSITEGSQPRKLMVVVPPLDDRGMPIPNRVAIGHEEYGSMLNVLRYPASTSGLYLMQTKEPTFINGNYRLNFRGRVKIPSVKNFQIVSAEDTNDVIVQFGKIGDDRFHLDFKAPFSAFQAFSLALSQFNL